MLPLAPGRFSTTNGWLSDSPSACARMRAKTSVPPPGDEGTTSFTGRAGQSWACAPKPRTNSAAKSKIRCMESSYLHVHSLRGASGDEILVARVLAPDGRIGFGFSSRLDATEARH